MPYSIVRRNRKYCVVKTETDERFGCHRTRAGAARQIAAIVTSKTSAKFKEMSDGSIRFFLAYTNNIMDREGDILTKEAHKAYVDKVLNGGIPYPVVLFSHNKDIDTIGHTDVIGYDEDTNFMYASGIVHKEGEHLVRFIMSKQKEIPLGVSHGMLGVTRDNEVPQLIKSYVTWEISILPLNKAANTLTFVEFKERFDMLKSTQREALINAGYSGDDIDSYEQALSMQSVIADALGMPRKEFTGDDDSAEVQDELKEMVKELAENVNTLTENINNTPVVEEEPQEVEEEVVDEANKQVSNGVDDDFKEEVIKAFKALANEITELKEINADLRKSFSESEKARSSAIAKLTETPKNSRQNWADTLFSHGVIEEKAKKEDSDEMPSSVADILF